MTLKRPPILALVLLTFFALLGFGIALQSTSVLIRSNGTIVTTSPLRYICGNYNSTHYYAQNIATGQYERISTNAAQTISYALGKLTLGRTGQETVLLKGDFLIGTTITLNQGNVLLDCRQATLTLTTSTILFDISDGSHYTVLGGHCIGPNTGSATALEITNCANVLVDGIDIEGFTGNFNGIILGGYGASGMTIQNCTLHDNAGSGGITIVNTGYGYTKIINCSIGNPAQGIFIGAHCPSNQILGCEFYGWNVAFGHAIYLDGSGSTDEGNNIVSGNIFHDGVNGAGLHIKCHNNSIHDNIFYNFSNTNTVPFSIYSQYSPSTANDNDIFNNTLTDCIYGMWVGNNPATYPTLRNKIHDNTFNRVTKCIMLNPWDGSTKTVEGTWIYYNTFRSCSNIFPLSESPANLIKNTVVAYNDFGGTVTDLSIESYVNTMVYGNVGMADFNVPSPLPIPPRTS